MDEYGNPAVPAVPRFTTAAEAQTYHVLTQIAEHARMSEHHTRIIKGWIIFFGILVLLACVFMGLAWAVAINGGEFN